MVTDVESPLIKTPDKGRFPLEDMEKCLKGDDTGILHRLIEDWGFESVLHYTNIPGSPTAIHAASEAGAVRCLEKLLNAKPNPPAGDVPDRDGRTPLFSAVSSGNHQCVQILVNSNIQINARNDQGHSILHWLIYSFNLCKDNHEKQGRLVKCLEILLVRRDLDLEPRDNSNLTPLLAAAKLIPSNDGVRRKGLLISCCRLLVGKGASLDAYDKTGVTARQVFEDKQALTSVLMGERESAPTRPFASQLLDFLIQGAYGDFISNRLVNQPQEEANRLVNSYIGSQTILFYVVDKGYTRVVKDLLEASADPWKKQIVGEEMCLHRALSRGSFQIVDLLITHMKMRKKARMLDLSDESFKLLKNLLDNFKKAPGTLENDHFKCLERLLQPDVVIDINSRSTGLTPQTVLHVAASHNNQRAMKILLEQGAYIGDHEEQKKILSILRPDTLRGAMDNCIKYRTNKGDTSSESENALGEDYTLSLDYRFICPPNNEKASLPKNEVATLMDLIKNEQHRKAASHPLIQVFLYSKWRKVLPLYLLNLLLYLAFVILLTSYMYILKDFRILQSLSQMDSYRDNVTITNEIQNYRTTTNILMAFLFILTLYMLVREIFQVLFSPKTYYTNFENYLEWALIIFVIVLCCANLSVEFTRHLAAYSMIIGWYEFVLLLGRAPPLAIYVTMLRHVSTNFIKLIVLYGALLLAFTVSFNIILQPAIRTEDSDFGDFWSSLPKAIVMATGEFEYSDLSKEFPSTILFSSSAVLIFLIFLFLIFLVLMNVMNGLAVSDTQKVVDDAILYSLTSRLELIYLIEELLLKSPFFNRYLSWIQIISRPSKPMLIARVNHPKFSERIRYGEHLDEYCKLDRNTADILKSHRLQHLADEEQAARDRPIAECLNLLLEIREWTEQHSPAHQSRIVSPSSSRATMEL